MFENPADAQAQLAGADRRVNVGKVTSIEPEGDMAKVTFTVDDAGQPIHSDATVEVRPRLFLEGNFFLDLIPGSPSAPELPQRHDAHGHPDLGRGAARPGADGAAGARSARTSRTS